MELSLTTTRADSRLDGRVGGPTGGRVRDPTGTATIVEVDGAIDIASSPRLRSRLVDLIDEGCRALVVDFTRVGFVDSTGLGVLIGVRRRLRAVGGELTLVVPPGEVRDLLAVTELDTIFTIRESATSPTEH